MKVPRFTDYWQRTGRKYRRAVDTDVRKTWQQAKQQQEKRDATQRAN